MLTQMAVIDRVSFAELEAINRAYTWLMVKRSLLAIALMSGALFGLMVLGYVFANALVKFNAEWTKRNAKNKPIVTIDDFSDIKEFDFLDVLYSASMIGKSVKDELKQCLQFRNGCGHPNSLVVGEARVASHLETLINNVYLKF